MAKKNDENLRKQKFHDQNTRARSDAYDESALTKEMAENRHDSIADVVNKKREITGVKPAPYFNPRLTGDRAISRRAMEILAEIKVGGDIIAVRRQGLKLLGLEEMKSGPSANLGLTERNGGGDKVEHLIENAARKLATALQQTGADIESRTSADLTDRLIATMQHMHEKATRKREVE